MQGLHREVAEFLIEKCDASCLLNYHAESTSGDFETPLFVAVEQEDLNFVKFFVDKGADVNDKVPCLKGGTVLHRACKVRNTNGHLILFLDSFKSLLWSLCFDLIDFDI